MRYVLDASIAVAGAIPTEPLHRAARATVDLVIRATDSIVVPAIFQVEVTSALARRGLTAANIAAYVAGLLARAEVVTIGPKRARSIAALAQASRLRAGDACYVWVARDAGVRLLTDDAEIIVRGAAHCGVSRLEPSGAWNP